MHKVWVIARREYRAMVRTKAFLISMILMPIFLLGSIVVHELVDGQVDASDKTLLVCDGTGVLFPHLEKAVEVYNKDWIFDDERQVESKLILKQGPPAPLTGEQRLELSAEVKAQKLYAFAEIPPSVLQKPQAGAESAAAEPAGGAAGSGRREWASVKLHTEKIGFNRMIRDWFRTSLNQIVQAERLRQHGLDEGEVAWVSQPITVGSGGLYIKSGDAVSEQDESARGLAFFTPMVLMMLMFMAIIISAQPMLQSVIEEKQQRIAEVLLGSVRPFDLMLGKLVGNVGVSLTIVGVYLIGGYIALDHYGHAGILPVDLVVWFIIYQVLAALLFGAVFIAIGAACTEIKEAQNFLTPTMILLVVPMFVWMHVLEDPMSRFSTWLSFFPPTTPMLMILRLASSTVVPLWQPLLGIAVVLLTTLLCVFAAGRVFRIGILAHGKAPKVTQLVRWIITG